MENSNLNQRPSEIETLIQNLHEKGISDDEIRMYFLCKDILESEDSNPYLYRVYLSIYLTITYNFSMNFEFPGGKTKLRTSGIEIFGRKNMLYLNVEQASCVANFLTNSMDFKEGIFICPGGILYVIKGPKVFLYKFINKLKSRKQSAGLENLLKKEECKRCYARRLLLSGRFTYIHPISEETLKEEIKNRIKNLEEKSDGEIKKLYEIIVVEYPRKMQEQFKISLKEAPSNMYG